MCSQVYIYVSYVGLCVSKMCVCVNTCVFHVLSGVHASYVLHGTCVVYIHSERLVKYPMTGEPRKN